MEAIIKGKYSKKTVEYLGITIGTLIVAVAMDAFLVPNKIAAGGVSGIATIVYYLAEFPVGLVMLCLNVPLFLLAFFTFGLSVIIRSLYGTVLLSAAIDFISLTPQYLPTQDPLLAGLFGGVLSGLGLGMVFRCKGTTGGTDLAAILFRRYFGINIGAAVFIVDSLIIVCAGVIFNPELALYALISLFVTSWIIDVVQDGISYAKEVLIISSFPDLIVQSITAELDRGVTLLSAKGGYTGQDKSIIISVVNRSEIAKLKELIHKTDPDAFVILHNVYEVLGEGFKKYD